MLKDNDFIHTVGHLVWPLQYQQPKCFHKGYIHPKAGYRCRYCGVKLKSVAIKLKAKAN